MDASNSSYSDASEAVITELVRLVEEGWTEQQIARMVRKRATNSTTSDAPGETWLGPLSRQERNRLEFTRWLYTSGRLAS